MTASPFEEDKRALACEKFDAGEWRAALHIWDSLEFPELLSADEVTMFETARRVVATEG